MSISIADGLVYDTEDREVRSQTDAEVCAIESLSVVSRLSQLTRGIPGCLKPTGFRATLKRSMGHLHGSSRKAQEAPVILTQSCTTLPSAMRLRDHSFRQASDSVCTTVLTAKLSKKKKPRFARFFGCDVHNKLDND